MYMSNPSSPAMLWMVDDFPDPGAPCCTVCELNGKLSCSRAPYQEIAPPERDTCQCVSFHQTLLHADASPTSCTIPRLTNEEFASIIQEHLLYPGIKDDAANGTFGIGCDVDPVVHARQGINLSARSLEYKAHLFDAHTDTKFSLAVLNSARASSSNCPRIRWSKANILVK